MYRGRLHHQFLMDIRRLDMSATAAVSGAGYDQTFREERRKSGTTPEGTATRAEMAALLIPCQWESTKFKHRQRTPDGNDPQSSIECILHRDDLERLGLLTDNIPALRAMDRIDAVYRMDGATKVLDFSTPPNKPLYIDRIEPNDTLNIWVITVTNTQRGIAA